MDALLLDGQPVVRTDDVAGWLASLGFDDLGVLIRELGATAAPSVPAACTGYLDEQGQLAHDGETCPLHECPTVVRLSGGDVVGIEVGSPLLVEVRQYHADHLDSPAEGDPRDEVGRYEVVGSAVSGAAPVTAGPSPGSPAARRGVRAWATLEDNEDAPERLVTVRYYLDPAPPGLDTLVYSHQAVRVPAEHVYEPVEGTNLVAMDAATHERVHRGEDPHA